MRVVLDTNLIVRAAGERAALGPDLLILATGASHSNRERNPLRRGGRDEAGAVGHQAFNMPSLALRLN
jgi:hypothetical protein